MKFIFSILLAMGSTLYGYAQTPNKYIHAGVGLTAYKGELNTYNNYGAAYHVGVQFNRKKRLNGSFNLGFGAVTGENRNFEIEGSPNKIPNKFFKTQFVYGNYALHLNLLKKPNYVIYVSQGIGFIRFTPTDEFDSNLQDQNNTRADDETYSNITLTFPTKIGATYLLPNDFGIGIQAGFYGTLTDYLDNISDLGDSQNDNLLEWRFSFYVPLYKDSSN